MHIREGSVAGGGKHPTSMSVATTNLADRVTNPVQVAFSKIHDGLGLGECGPIMGASLAVISGRDPRNGNEPFVNQIFLLDTGGAGAAAADAWLTICHAGNSGMCFIDSVELDERTVVTSGGWSRTRRPADGRAPAGYCEYARGRRGFDGCKTSHVEQRHGTCGGLSRRPSGTTCEAATASRVAGHRRHPLRPGETVVSYCAGAAKRSAPRAGRPRGRDAEAG